MRSLYKRIILKTTLIEDQIEDQVGNEIWWQVRDSMHEQIEDQLWRQIGARIMTKKAATNAFERGCILFLKRAITKGEMYKLRVLYDTYGRTEWKR